MDSRGKVSERERVYSSSLRAFPAPMENPPVEVSSYTTIRKTAMDHFGGTILRPKEDEREK